ncbi:hypothetical protein [Natronospora cellulosivora (SeqCode)]
MKKISIFLLIIVVSFTAVVFGESNDLEESSENNLRDSLIIRTGRLVNKDNSNEFREGMTMIRGDIQIESEWGIFYERENKAEIFDNVRLRHSKGEIRSGSMIALLDDDKYIFEDDVRMLQKLDDGEFTLLAPYLELMEEDNSFEANQGVVIDYSGRIIKADDVIYNAQEELMELFNNVYIEEENGDWVKSEKAIFYLDRNEFIAKDGVELEIQL